MKQQKRFERTNHIIERLDHHQAIIQNGDIEREREEHVVSNFGVEHFGFFCPKTRPRNSEVIGNLASLPKMQLTPIWTAHVPTGEWHSVRLAIQNTSFSNSLQLLSLAIAYSTTTTHYFTPILIVIIPTAIGKD